MDFSSFFITTEVRVFCKTPFAGTQRQRWAFSFFSLLQHHLLHLPKQPQALCSGLFTAMAPRAPLHIRVLNSRSSVPGNVEVCILRRSCQGSSLIANGLESASSFASDHILLFPNTEQTYLVSTSLFLPHFNYFFFSPVSAKKKRSLLLLGLIFFKI